MPRPQFRWRSRANQTVTLFDKTYSVQEHYGFLSWIPAVRNHRKQQQRSPRYFISFWLVPAWIALSTILVFTPSLAVAPPASRARTFVPKYKDIKVNTGYTVSASVWRTLYLVYGFDVLVIAIMLWQVRDILTVTVILAFLALLTWCVQVYRVAWAYVITPDNFIQHTGIWHKAEQSSIEAQSLGRVTARTSSPQILCKMLGIMDVVVQKKDGGEVVLSGIDNGEAIRDLIREVQMSFEGAVKDQAADQKQEVITNLQIRQELMTVNSNLDKMWAASEKFGRAYVAVSNRDARLMWNLHTQNSEIIRLLRLIASPMTEAKTAPVPVQPTPPIQDDDDKKPEENSK